MFIASDGEADGADAGVEVKHLVGSDMAFDFFEGELVDWKIDLEKAVRRVGILLAQDNVGKITESRVRLFVFIKATRDFAFLVATE